MLLPVAVALMLAACSSNSNRGVAGSVGVGTGVALGTPGSITQIQVATTIVVTASVAADVNNAGVTWSMSGVGVLTGQTPTSVTYNAPASATGGVDATITATSVVNPASTASVTLVVLGTPIMNPPQLFPGNVNVAYGANITVAGGLAPFTWVLAANSGALPPGIVLNGSTTAISSISGTPTTAGSYTFTVQATDTNNKVASQTMTMTVKAQDSCLLEGNYAFIVSGFRGGGPMTHVGSIAIDASGNISGEQDYKDGHRTTHETLNPSLCTNRQTNSGQLTLNSPSGQILYNFSATPPDAQGNLNSARLQLIGGFGTDSASGQLSKVDATAITAAPPTGNFAFGLLTTANQEPDTIHSASAGRFTTDSTGTISAGLIDSNAAPPLTGATLSGVLSAPDSTGRGTATFTVGSQTSTLAYYIINAAKMYLMNIDATVGTPRSSGYLSAQVGNTAGGTFDNGALAAAPAIISLWGSDSSGVDPHSSMTLGRLYNASAATGTLDAEVDSSDRITDSAGILYSAQSYSVDSSGRGTLSLATASLATRNFVFYLDGAADGYVLEQGTASGSAGLLEAQYVPSGGLYPDTLPGFFVMGTQYAQTAGPIVLTATIGLSFGALSSNYTTGQFAIDTSIGRGFGSVSQSGLPTTAAALYLVSPTKIDLMTFGTIQVDSSISWLIQN
ncbi:MAG: beta strand repeat-containing protein [Steroidobacterales bacterium]